MSGKVTMGGDDVVTETDITGGTLSNAKPIYWHTVHFRRGGSEEAPTTSRLDGYAIILNNSSTPIISSTFIELIRTDGVVIVVHAGVASESSGTDLTGCVPLTRLVKTSNSSSVYCYIRDATTNEESSFTINPISGWVEVTDLGANKIN